MKVEKHSRGTNAQSHSAAQWPVAKFQSGGLWRFLSWFCITRDLSEVSSPVCSSLVPLSGQWLSYCTRGFHILLWSSSSTAESGAAVLQLVHTRHLEGLWTLSAGSRPRSFWDTGLRILQFYQVPRRYWYCWFAPPLQKPLVYRKWTKKSSSIYLSCSIITSSPWNYGSDVLNFHIFKTNLLKVENISKIQHFPFLLGGIYMF